MSKRTTFAGRIPAHDLVDQLNVVRIQTFGGPEGSGRDDRHEDGQPVEEAVYLLNHKRTCRGRCMRRNLSLLQTVVVVYFRIVGLPASARGSDLVDGDSHGADCLANVQMGTALLSDRFPVAAPRIVRRVVD
ncbi:hypothetical protein [Propionivibrio soli]|uniref:hypothetical protein n=1 Tax=Propionivibrio soli TaxID=2976531 RepID=UPI0021E959F7|nr:hypothetical protein [Propionivibrio soli]